MFQSATLWADRSAQGVDLLLFRLRSALPRTVSKDGRLNCCRVQEQLPYLVEVSFLMRQECSPRKDLSMRRVMVLRGFFSHASIVDQPRAGFRGQEILGTGVRCRKREAS